MEGLDRLARAINLEIGTELQRIGIFHRIFSRAKTENSIEKKIIIKNYQNNKTGKLMQDIIGIRVIVYFKDDLPIVQKAIKSKFNFVDETIDKMDETVFQPNRINLIFRLSEEFADIVEEVAISKYKYIDTTYEVQLRTIFSEGWHEVEHDLRYKCLEDWNEYTDSSRILNGIYASLETSDWSILSLFDKLAYQQYKEKNWSAMLRNKFRMRLSDDNLNSELLNLINNTSDMPKRIFRVDRQEFLNRLFEDEVRFPLNLSNLIFVLNGYYWKYESIYNITPESLKSKKEIFG